MCPYYATAWVPSQVGLSPQSGGKCLPVTLLSSNCFHETSPLPLCDSSPVVDLQKPFLRLQHPPTIVKGQSLQDRPRKESYRTLLVISFSPQLRPLTCIISNLQPILHKNTLLSQALGGRLIHVYR